MRTSFSQLIEAGRDVLSEPPFATHKGDRFGRFLVRCPLTNVRLKIIISDGADWEQVGLPLPVWEHVSVSTTNRVPTWEEMCWVKEQFFEDDEVVVQLHPAKKDWINCHPHVLHLWRVVGVDFPMPPKITV
jgi:hypothetical protein